MGSPSWPLEGTSPAHTLILDFCPPELGEQKCLLLFATRLWPFVRTASAEEYEADENVLCGGLGEQA